MYNKEVMIKMFTNTKMKRHSKRVRPIVMIGTIILCTIDDQHQHQHQRLQK